MLFAVIATVCISCGAAKEDPELKVLSQALAAKKVLLSLVRSLALCVSPTTAAAVAATTTTRLLPLSTTSAPPNSLTHQHT